MNKSHILVIGNEDYVMDLQSKFWESTFEVSGVKSYSIALARIKEIEFKIVIIQDEFSAIDTFELCKQLKSFTRHHYHVLIALELENKELISAYMKSGADDFIQASINLDEIVLRLKVHINLLEIELKTIELNKKKAIEHAIKEQMKLLILKDDETEEVTAGDYLKQVFNQAEYGILVLDQKNRIVIQNSASKHCFGKITGKDAEQFLNSNNFTKITEHFDLERLNETNITLDYGVRTYNFTKFPLAKKTKNINIILFIEDVSEDF